MRKLIVTIVTLGLLIYFSGCKSYYLNKYCIAKTIIQTDSIHDTLRIVNNYKQTDTVKVIVKPTDISVNLGNPCDSSGKLKDGQLIKLRNGNNYLLLKVKDGELMLDTYQDSIVNLTTSIKEIKDSMLFYKERVNVNSNQVIDKTKNLTNWQLFKTTGWFDIIIVLVILGLIYLIFKF